MLGQARKKCTCSGRVHAWPSTLKAGDGAYFFRGTECFFYVFDATEDPNTSTKAVKPISEMFPGFPADLKVDAAISWPADDVAGAWLVNGRTCWYVPLGGDAKKHEDIVGVDILSVFDLPKELVPALDQKQDEVSGIYVSSSL